MNKKKVPSYNESIEELFEYKHKEDNKKVIQVTFQITEDCTLRCKYCYQHSKSPKIMSLETGKKFIDVMFRDMQDKYYCIILDFIGGEPLMQPQLISDLVDYWYYKCIMEDNLEWGMLTRICICSNGTEWDKPEVQKLITKLGKSLSFTVSIDGNKELHDSARIHPNGQGSYDEAIHAATEFEKKYNTKLGSKMTIAPSNIIFVYPALKHYLEQGADEIFANCVFEKGWTNEHATLLYNEMKKLADYKLKYYPNTYLSFFEEYLFCPLVTNENNNWCLGKDSLILTNEGYKPIQDIKIGDFVYTHTGELKPVINTTHHFDENVCKVKVSGVFDFIATKNHKLFVTPIDYLGYKGIKHYKESGKYEIQQIKNNDLIHLYKHKFGNIRINSDIAYLVGRFIGDGYTTTQEAKEITCAFEEVSELEQYFKRLDLDYSIYHNKTADQLHIIKGSKKENNIILNSILKDCGLNATTKHIPKQVWNWDKESVINLIKGYMAADGTINKKEQYRFNTVSYQLANEMMILISAIGFNPTVYINKRGGISSIQERTVNVRDRYEVYFYKDPKRCKYVSNTENERYTYGIKTEDVEPQEVYNITVADNHSYIVNGVVSSNCGGTGLMLACDPDGVFYPCLRYMPSSVGRNKDDYITCGNIEEGFNYDKLKEMQKVTRRSQSTDECFYCPIATGCAWCSAYNWESQGSYNKRATYICPMHKARALVNVYYWNKYYRQIGSEKRLINFCPKEWALEIISEEEYNMLNELSKFE